MIRPHPLGRPSLGARPWTTLAALLLFALGCLAYANSFSVPLLLDDTVAITANSSIHHLWPPGSVLLPPSHLPTAGRPLLNLSFALNYAAGGTDVWGYHAVNLGIHLLAGLTLFGLIRQTLRRPVVPEKFRATAELLALLGALLWLLHPLQTSSVTYLSQRAESLMGLLYLTTLYCFSRGTSATTTRPTLWLTLSVLCCFLGMATKEGMVTAPLLVLLYDRTFVSGAFQPALHRHRWLYAGLASSWLLLAGLMLSSPLQDRGVGLHHTYTWWSYALAECPIVLRYLKLTVWPSPLVFDYGIDWPSPGLLAALGGLVLIASLLLATGVALRRRPIVGFLLAWFFLLLAPTSTFVPISGQPMAENRVYLALAAVTVAVTAAAWAVGRVRGLAVLLLVAASLGLATFHRNTDYQTEVAIWTDTAAKQPLSARAHHNLGEALRARGEWSAAIAQYETALRLRPVYPEAHSNLGTVLARLPGRVPEAIAHYESALAQQPDFADAHNNLGAALAQIPGRSGDAQAHLQRALDLGFDRAEVHFNLGLLYLETPGQLASAIAQYEKGLALDSANINAHLNLGNALSTVPGRLPDAILHYETALRLRPDNASAENNLASALLALPDRLPEAIRHYRSAVRLNPDYAEAHYNLALALLKTPGQEQEAASHLETALRLRPDLTQARDALLRLNR